MYFEHVRRLFAPEGQALAGFSDAQLFVRDGDLWLSAVTAAEDQLISWRVLDVPSEAQSVDLQDAFGLSAPLSLDRGVLDGQDVLWSFGLNDQGFTAFAENGLGELDPILTGGTNQGALLSFVHDPSGPQELFYTTIRERGEIDIWQRSGSAVTLWQSLPTSQSETGSDNLLLANANVGSNSFLLSVSSSNNTINVYAPDAMSGLVLRDTIGAQNGFGVAVPSAIKVVEFAGETLALVAASGSSSISVLAIDATGMIEARDHVIDDLNSRFQNVSQFDVLQAGEHVYVLANGQDDGLSLFTLLPGGQLVHLESVEGTFDAPIDDLTSLTAAFEDDTLHVYTTSEADPAVDSWSVDVNPGDVLQASVNGGNLIGTSADDILVGSAAGDNLIGADGRDILFDGLGFDTLTGGSGEDLFVLAADDTQDRINGFEVGVDKIDLTGWGRVYSKSALTFEELANGIRIRFRDERLDVFSSDFSPITSDMFDDNDLFGLSHVDVSIGVASEILEGSDLADVLNGNVAGDVLSGLGGADTLSGGGRHDTLNGGAGADHLIGGDGIDTVDFTGSVGSLRVDLLFPSVNTNVAAGDSFDSIENLIGSQGSDNLRGTFEDNVIQGMRNVDFLFGRRGEDTLLGGIGDDVLFGGVDGDVLDGGPGRDRAQYSEGLSAVHVDLENPTNNTGEAASDTFINIEDLAGSRFDDTLLGDASDNRLFGREGADRLFGRSGNDALNGGAHADRLDGGAGNDSLRGGTHNDTFVFNGGHDLIEDFTLSHADRLVLEASFLPGITGLFAQEVVDNFANVENGNTVFDFGADHSLTLLNFTDLGSLSDNLFLF